MIIKPILEKIKDYLENEFSVNIYSLSGLRLAYVIYAAYITSETPFKQSKELMAKAHELINDGTQYIAFERSVYRELKNIYTKKDKSFIVLKVVYDIVSGIKIWV